VVNMKKLILAFKGTNKEFSEYLKKLIVEGK
jgi:hypothetical protein